jgi:hypothetical protein
MAIGQISETIILLLIPVFFTRFWFQENHLGRNVSMDTIRYVLFAYGNGMI